MTDGGRTILIRTQAEQRRDLVALRRRLRRLAELMRPARRRAGSWSDADLAYLRRWRGERTDAEIADALGRTAGAVKCRAQKLGLLKRDRCLTYSPSAMRSASSSSVRRTRATASAIRRSCSSTGSSRNSLIVCSISASSVDMGDSVAAHDMPPPSPSSRYAMRGSPLRGRPTPFTTEPTR